MARRTEADYVIESMNSPEQRPYIAFMLIQWDGYNGEKGPKKSKLCKWGEQPNRNQLLRFFGARDFEHLCGMCEDGYAQVLVSVVLGNWVEVDIHDLVNRTSFGHAGQMPVRYK